MIRALSFLLLALIPLAAFAGDGVPRPVAQVGLLPLAERSHLEIDALFANHWRDYYGTNRAESFRQSDIRAGRIDLDGDGVAELIAMIDHPAWLSEDGKPFVVATWTKKGWLPVGWGWGDEDTIFVTEESDRGWATIDTGSQIMRWAGREYGRSPRPQRTF